MTKYCKCRHPKVNFHISLSHCVNCNKQIKKQSLKKINRG